MVCAGGSKMRPDPQGQRPAIALKKLVLPPRRLPMIKTRSPGLITACFSLSIVHLAGEAMPMWSNTSRSSAVGTTSIRPVSPPSLSISIKRKAEARDPQKRGPPVSDQTKIVDEPAKRLLHLIEGPGRHHQSAERHFAGEISGRRHDERGHDREPSITCSDPGKAGDRADQPPHHRKDLIKLAVQIILFVRFAAIKRDGFGALVDPHETETQIRLARVAFGVERDQRTPDPPASKGRDSGIDQRNQTM